MPTFSSGFDFMMGLSNPHLHAKFEVAIASAVVKIFKGHPKCWGASLAQVNAYFFSWVGFYDGHCQTPTVSQI